MTDPEKTLHLYLTIKKHFQTKSFDVVKTNGRMNVSGLLNKRPDKTLIKMFSKKCDNNKHAASILVSNFAYGLEYPFDDIDTSLTLYTQWQKNRQSLQKIYTDDLGYIKEFCEYKKLDFQDVLSYTKGNVPLLFKFYLTKKINIETISIIDYYEDLFDSWKDFYPLFKLEMLRFYKVRSFVKFNPQAFSGLLTSTKEITKEYTL